MSKSVEFGTPIWEYNIPHLVEGLIDIADSYVVGDYFSLPGTSELREIIERCFAEICDEYKLNGYSITGRQHPIRPGECDTPHTHDQCSLVAVYYLHVPENSGKLMLYSPIPGMWVQGGGIRRRPYIEIEPYPGLLVIMPGYLLHSVGTNLSNEVRLSIAIELK